MKRRLHSKACFSTSPVKAEVEDEADDIDNLSSHEETILGCSGGSGQRKRLVFLKEEL